MAASERRGMGVKSCSLGHSPHPESPAGNYPVSRTRCSALGSALRAARAQAPRCTADAGPRFLWRGKPGKQARILGTVAAPIRQHPVVDLVDRGDAGERHADVELLADHLDRGAHAGLAAGAEAIEKGAADQASLGAERER